MNILFDLDNYSIGIENGLYVLYHFTDRYNVLCSSHDLDKLWEFMKYD